MSKTLTLLTLAGLLLLGTMAAPAEAADIGCGGRNVEVCAPVCIDGPCTPYVCVHPQRLDSLCVR